MKLYFRRKKSRLFPTRIQQIRLMYVCCDTENNLGDNLTTSKFTIQRRQRCSELEALFHR
jgi:hypothetical protein